ncbi:MAG: PKD domain-containing protein [Myxococcales bacterium]|nr:PKD domain-containing protein [Myxococcales bacterium]MDH3843222.1 PKD domain-containing protein [Myxococcales bacterium]
MSRKSAEVLLSGRAARVHLVWLVALSIALLLAPRTGIAAPGKRGQVVAVEGKLEVIVSDDFERGQAERRFTLEESVTGKRWELRFEQEAPQGLMTGARVRARGLPSGKELIVDANGSGGAGVTTIAAGQLMVSGEQRTLVMIANFQDADVSCSVDAVQDLMFTDPSDGSIDDLYRETSFGEVWFTGDTVGPFDIGYSSSTCDVAGWSEATDAAARASGIDPDTYMRKVYVLPPNVCPAVGSGTHGGNPSRAWIFRCGIPDVYAHELGHNLGMQHASTPEYDYGDNTDFMGLAYNRLRQVNAPHKEQMGWLPATTITSGGTYQVAPLAPDPSQVGAHQSFKIAKPDTGDFYYLSFRTATGFDANLSSIYLNRLSVHEGDGATSQKTYLLALLPDGESFYDAVNGITFTQLSHSPNGSTFSVSFDGASSDPCAGVVCQNGGTCDAGSCLCAAGFAGAFCEINIDDCASVVCQNGGLCVDGVDSYTCECPMGFTGAHCETNVNDCADNPCQNGGICVDDVAGYTCDCALGFEGTHCEIDTDDCTPNPCQNGGTCFDGLSSYACECIDGYTGASCELPPPGGNRAPLVSLSVSSTSGEAPLDVAVEAAASDADGQVVAYAWSFGDGSSEETTTNATSHTYTQKGRYNACVTVTDDQGAIATDCAKIRVVSKGGIGGSKGKGNNRKALTLESAPLPDGCDVVWEFFAIDMDDARTAAGAWNVVEEAVVTHGNSKSKSGRLPACFSLHETYELCASLGDGEARCWLIEVDANGDLNLLEGDADRFTASESSITEEPRPTQLLGGCSAIPTGQIDLWDLLLLAGLFSLWSRRRRRQGA